MSTRRMTAELVMSLRDEITGPMRRIKSQFRDLRKTALGPTADISKGIRDQTRQVKRDFREMGHAVTAGFGIVAAVGGRSVYDFEKTMNKAQAMGRITADQRVELNSFINDINSEFPFSMGEIAGQAVELFKAGLNFDQVKGSLRHSLQLALIGADDVSRAQAADIATNIMTAMRLPSETMEQVSGSLQKVVDRIAYAATSSNTDIRLMGETFKYVGPMAAAAGIGIDKVTAASMLMANNGIKGSEAGVAMRSAIVRMVRPTKDSRKALAGLGLDFANFVKQGAKVNTTGFIGMMTPTGIDLSPFKAQIDALLSDTALVQKPQQLAARMSDMLSGALNIEPGDVLAREKLTENIADSLAAAGAKVDMTGFFTALRERGANVGQISRIFDSRQGARLITLLTNDLNAMEDEVRKNAEGAAQEMADTMQGGIVGAVAKIKAAVDKLFSTIADSGVLDQVTEAIKSLTSGINRLSETSPGALKWGVYIAAAVAVLSPIGFALSTAAAGLSVFAGAIRLVGLQALWFSRVALIGPVVASWKTGAGIIAGSLAAAKGSVLGFVAAARIMGTGAALKMAGASVLGLLNPVRIVRVALIGLRGALLATGIGAVAIGIGMAGTYIYKNWSNIKAMMTGVGEGFREALGPISPMIGGVIDSVKGLFGWFGSLVDESDAGAESWTETGRRIGRVIGGIARTIKDATADVAEFFNSFSWEKLKAFDFEIPSFSDLIPTFDFSWDSIIPSIMWPSVVGVLAWKTLIGPLIWRPFIGTIKWALWAGRLGWGLLVSTLKWTSKLIPKISWRRRAGALSWSKLVGRLWWWRHIKPIAWARFAGKLSWSKLISAIKWTASLIPKIPWGLRIAGPVWSKIITALTWTSKLIPTIPWARLATRLSLRNLVFGMAWTTRLIPAIPWGRLAGTIALSSLATKPTWTSKLIPTIPWGTLIKPLSWFGKGMARLIPGIGWALLAKDIGVAIWGLAGLEPIDWKSWITEIEWPDLNIFNEGSFVEKMRAIGDKAGQALKDAMGGVLDWIQLKFDRVFVGLDAMLTSTRSLAEKAGFTVPSLASDEAKRRVWVADNPESVKERAAMDEISKGGLLGNLAPVAEQVPAEGFVGPPLPPALRPIEQREKGGPVRKRRPYLVGERGPELFIPDISGMVRSTIDTRSLLRAAAVAPALTLTSLSSPPVEASPSHAALPTIPKIVLPTPKMPKMPKVTPPSVSVAMPNISIPQPPAISPTPSRGPARSPQTRSMTVNINLKGEARDPQAIARAVRQELEAMEENDDAFYDIDRMPES